MLRLAFAILAPLAALGCGRSHDLGVETTTSSSGSGGGSTATSTTTSVTSGTGATGGAGAGGAGGAAPTGPTALTVVNGINDYPAVRFCFLPGDTPWPASASGLPFAAGEPVDIATDLPSGTDVTPWVIAGDLVATAGLTCTQILAAASPDAGGPTILATPLAVLPQSIFSSHESLLLVSTGCLGGAGHDDPNAMLACGMGYSSQTPNASLAVVAMSRRTDPKHVSVQIAAASPPTPTSDYKVMPATTNAMPITVAPSLPLGAIGPSPPFAQLTADAYGALNGAAIQTYPAGSSALESQTVLEPLLQASAVGTAGFVDGASLVFVAVGAAPGLHSGSFWHALTYAVVKADPG